MSDRKTWVTPSQAIKEMAGKLPQVDANALLYWARDGKIQIQCQEVTCSDDGGLSICTVAQIPSDFWWSAVTNGRPNWTAGEVTAQMEVDDGWFEQWTVSGLKIELAGLQQAINIEIGQTDQKPKRAAKERWQQQRLTRQQADALKFIDIAITKPTKDPLGSVALHRAYLKWHADPKNKRTGEPLKRSAFGKWKERYLDGWRVSDSLKLVYNS
jgi:hypothetical protein